MSHTLNHAATELAPVLDTFSALALIVLLVLVVLLTPLVELLNVVTMPLGYQIQSCPYCPAVGVAKREYARCDYCESRFAYYGVSTSSRVDGEVYRFCSLEHLDNWKEAQEQ